MVIGEHDMMNAWKRTELRLKHGQPIEDKTERRDSNSMKDFI